MPELLRFRLTRAPQKRAVESGVRVPLYRTPSTPPVIMTHVPQAADSETPLKGWLQILTQDVPPDTTDLQRIGVSLLGKPAALRTPVCQLEGWLTGCDNRPSSEELSAKLNELCLSSYKTTGMAVPAATDLAANAHFLMQLAGDDWWLDRQSIGFSLIAAMLRNPEPSRAMYFNRLMLVVGLVELAEHNSDRLKATDDIYWALRSRVVILPQLLAALLRKRRPISFLARRPGFSDYYIVRDEWARYEAGEIAHVENVMASETRERRHTRLTETEETVTTEEERVKLEEHDTQTTDRFDLHAETNRESSLSIGTQGSVDASGQYGLTKISTHLGGNVDYSLNESQSQATTTSQEIVGRAVVKVEEKVRQARTTRSLSRIKEVNKHSFKNDKPDAEHINGIYRWVDKIQRVQMFRYPHRFLFEFEVPEPGAWIRWLLDNKKKPMSAENPADMTTEITEAGGIDGTDVYVKDLKISYYKGMEPKTVNLTAEHITPRNYLAIAALYKTLGLNPPPKTKWVNISHSQDTVNPRDVATIKKNDPVRFINLTQITVPEGYTPNCWYALGEGWGESEYNAGVLASVIISLGNSSHCYVAGDNGSAFNFSSGPEKLAGVTGALWTIPNEGIEQTQLPVTARLDNVRGFNLHITLECEPSETSLAKWRLDTYGRIAQAYYAMKHVYDEEMAAQSVRSGVQIEGLSPVQNAEIARTELKKAIIEMLTVPDSNSDFSGRNAMKLDKGQRMVPPEIDLAKAVHSAPEIQFLEQAFEWENLSYVLYPYFWADKTQWDQLADLSGPDSQFVKFLRAGSARVIVPARPGFEHQAHLYVDTGILWGGGPTPSPDDDDYLSIGAEIRAQEEPPLDGIAGASWEVRLPTTLVWLDNEDTTLPVENPNMKLDAPPGKVLP